MADPAMFVSSIALLDDGELAIVPYFGEEVYRLERQ
jgi:hypothetical protein